MVDAYVSILVVLDWVFKRRNARRGHVRGGVSILVVLDWVFKQLAEFRPQVHGESFNPCCIGLGIQTRGGTPVRMGNRPVSILVVLDWVFKPDAPITGGCGVICFNPCCIGLGIQTIANLRQLVDTASFNPCCIGLGIQTCVMDAAIWAGRVVSILVVLDWVFKLYKRYES